MACIKGRSLTTSTKYYLLLSTYPWLNSFTVEGKFFYTVYIYVQNVTLTSYLPHLLNAVCERPLRVRSTTIQAATIHVSSCNAMHRNQF